MRIYVHQGRGPMRGRWFASVPEIPGAASQDLATRDEAIARCRVVATEERRALERLGAAIEVDADDAVVDWPHRPSLIPEALLPIAPALVRAAVGRIDELAAALDREVSTIAPEEWDRATGGWTVRMVLDHVASGFAELLRDLEPWRLDPDAAQTAALDELIARLEARRGERFAVEHFGLNWENGRVRWTPRKVARVVRALQEAWLAYLGGTGPEPGLAAGHEDAIEDDGPLSTVELAPLRRNDAELLKLVSRDERVRLMAFWYRYYRDRLVRWPNDVVERLRATREAARTRLLALDEGELALLRVAPNGTCWSVRQVAGVGITHLRDHREQIQRLRQPTTV